MMQNGTPATGSGRKRVVSSCTPCYTKKQKCNRRYPCNHCTRRRRPEECTYNPTPGSQVAPQMGNRSQDEDISTDHETRSQAGSGNDEPAGDGTASDWSTRKNSRHGQGRDSLAELFGHVEYSGANTLALVRNLGLNEDDSQSGNRDIPVEDYADIDKIIKRLPDRQIFDFLVQYYVTEVHWMEQVVYAPWFLGQYQKWWSSGRPRLVFDVEFAVLFLRICAYASQFLPSPSCTIDHIRGMPLTDVRDACHDISEKLAAICQRVNPTGALIRVQHLLILGLQRGCEGRISDFWEALSNAVRVAHRIGLHRGRTAWTYGMHEFDKEIRCRVLCNLYTWDSVLSRHLDCPSFFTMDLTPDHIPLMLTSKADDPNAPEEYSERVAQARLQNFWRKFPPQRVPDSEPHIAEERYQSFCSDYLQQIPLAFALEPCEDWDEQLPRLPLQRQMLHVAIFSSLCYNYRPVLFFNSLQLSSIPASKQLLLAFQKRTLAASALKLLHGVSKLHSMLGRAHTRLPTIILPTFEAAIILVSLTMDGNFPGLCPLGEVAPMRPLDADPLGAERAQLTREKCKQAIQDALARLEMLAEVSNMARVGASTLTRLMAKVPAGEVVPQTWPSLEAYDATALEDFLTVGSAETYTGSTLSFAHPSLT